MLVKFDGTMLAAQKARNQIDLPIIKGRSFSPSALHKSAVTRFLASFTLARSFRF